MEQHPIPQAITTYKFKLVGDMTLKQFLELAFGIVTAWIIFNSGLNFFFKWTLGPFFGFLGFALAFLPIEDRPLDQWIINLIRAIYAPTQFIYRVSPKKLDIFTPLNKPASPTEPPIKTDQGQLSDYLESLPPGVTSAFDRAEAKYLEYISNLFGALGSKPVSAARAASAPLLARGGVKGVRVRQLSHPQMCLLPRAVVFQMPTQKAEAAMPAVAKAPAKTSPRPDKRPASVKPKPLPIQPVPPPPRPPKTVPTSAPTFADDLVLPQKPDKPNLIAGITLDRTGKIIPNVILEIRDNQGFPVRALKSNKLGQFFIATPLPEGVYQIVAEHENHKFAIIKLEAKNELIPPLKIQAAA